MRLLAILVIMAASAFSGEVEWTHPIYIEHAGHVCTSSIPPICSDLVQQAPAEQALENNIRDTFGGSSISIADGAILCDLERCYTVRANEGVFEFMPVKDADFLSAVRIYRYKIAARALRERR